MYSLVKKIADNEKLIAFFVVIGGVLILLDILSGFQGTRFEWADMWHHRAVLIALAENPFNPSNPHILSDEGSRTFIPIYVFIGFLASVFGFSAYVSLAISSIINLILLVLGVKYFAKAMGSQNYIFLLFLLLYAWFLAPAYVGFHNVRTFAEANSYPAAHTFGLTLILWGLYIETIKRNARQTGRWLLILFLLFLVVLSHQVTALFCIGALFMYAFIPPTGHAKTLLKTTVVVTAAFLLTLLWPYFDMITVLLAGSHPGWFGETFFYEPFSVLAICLPALLALVFMPLLYQVRLANIMGICALSLFAIYMGTYFLDITAGHRLLPFWIFFLHIIIFIAFQQELSGTAKSSFIKIIKPIFIVGIMIISVRNSAVAFTDIFRPHLRAEYGWSFLNDEMNFYFDAMEKVNNDLPENAIVVGHNLTPYSIQGFGIPVVSIPRQAPMISDLAARQAATLQFFAVDVSCEQRLLAVKPYGATHAAYSDYFYKLDDKIMMQFSKFGEIINYDGLISIVKIPDQCPGD